METEQATLELHSQQGELLDEEQERYKGCVVLAAAKKQEQDALRLQLLPLRRQRGNPHLFISY